MRRLALTLVFSSFVCLSPSVAPAASVESTAASSWIETPAAAAALPLPELDPAVADPASYLGYPLGSRFTTHARLLGYLDTLERSSPRVHQLSYGATVEGRPLRLVVITSPENHARLDELRTGLRRLASGALSTEESEQLAAKLPVVAWLSYGVHGNESSSAEAAVGAAYVLAAARGEWAKRLDQMIVLIDPLVNPDGRERYVSGFAQRSGRAPNDDPDSAEHREPWPGGRFNHYLFDLNRDWAWLTQPESRQRIAAYRAWEPQVHVDFHEMSRESTYFFPPAAEPVNPEIDERVIGWLREFGRGNAAAFDRLGWPFFTRETYDLFYPGYGDAYPSLRGAVGMTYEVAGGGRAGAAVLRNDGVTLRLADRVARHLVTSLATLETAHAQRIGLLRAFAAGRSPSAGETRSYLWADDQPEARELAELLGQHGIAVRRLAQTDEIEAVSLRRVARGEAAKRRFTAGTFVVDGAQPLGRLTRALLERETPLSSEFLRAQRRKIEEGKDPDFYDITAWSLPIGWNLDAWVTTARVGRSTEIGDTVPGALRGQGDLGVALRPQGLVGYKAMALLLRSDARARVLSEDFQSGDTRLPAGSVVWTAGGDRELFARASAVASATGANFDRLASGFADRGASLGSETAYALRPVRIALVRGRGVDPTVFGALWSLLDQDLGIAHSVVELEDLARTRLERYDALVLPDGQGYGDALGEGGKAAIEAWVKAGGVLVPIGGAMGWAKEAGLLQLRAWEAPKHDPEAEDAAAPPENWIADQPLDTPGAILATRLRGGSSLLTAGVGSPPPVLFSGKDLWIASGDPRKDVLIAAEDPILAGFAWPEARQRLSGALLVTSQSLGSGQVVGFAQDPVFRSFWRGTMPLLLNAVLFEPSRHVD
jgi:hypothetical protein